MKIENHFESDPIRPRDQTFQVEPATLQVRVGVGRLRKGIVRKTAEHPVSDLKFINYVRQMQKSLNKKTLHHGGEDVSLYDIVPPGKISKN
jgi:hypothetical protein